MKDRILHLKKAACAFLVVLLLSMAGLAKVMAQGALLGIFSVGENTTVRFSQGNLQYIGSAGNGDENNTGAYWKFADHQWDYLGDNGQGSDSKTVDRDLFGWGTSGYNHGAVCYQPWSISTDDDDYYVYGGDTYNLFDQTGQADWGYNAISNGGNQENSGWRTLTFDEWDYVFNTRETISGIRYAKAVVNGVNGMILLPNNWMESVYALNNANNSGSGYDNNTITAEDWTNVFEMNGAVFLPAAGYYWYDDFYSVGVVGDYWSSCCNTSSIYIGNAYNVLFGNDNMYNFCSRFTRISVRLVRTVENSIHGYIDLGLPSGTLWATCNIGASTPDEYGDYFAWGETQPKDYYDWSTYQYCNNADHGYNGFADDLTVLQLEDDVATAIWGSGWRMPTQEEFEELYNNTTQTWTTQNGVDGRIFTAENGNSIFLPAAGYRNGSSSSLVGVYGDYWSSSLYVGDPNNARGLDFHSNSYGMSLNSRYYGFTVRPVRSSQVLSFSINATSDPVEGGIITGMGEYECDLKCTLTATPNEGYLFMYWMRNGEVVSRELEYSFVVTGNWNLVACFVQVPEGNIVFADENVKSICVSNWDTNGDGELSYAEAASVADLGEAFQWNWDITSFDELQYFVGLTSIGYACFSYSGLTSVVIPSNVTTIGDWAFESCGRLVSVTMLGPVTTIGEAIFYDCGGLTYIKLFALKPPIISLWSTFYGAGSFTVYIPCGSLANYQAADGWNELRLMEMCDGIISVTAQPFEGGIVSGSGSYEGGEVCTVTATPNEDYTFMYWTLDGEVVSTDPEYSFVVAGDANYVANYSLPLAINAVADPVEGGTVAGTGEYDYGTECTLTAMPNEVYSFMYWTEDGEVVSTDAMYSFTVTTSRDLVANFALPFTIAATANPSEGGTVAGAGEYDYGIRCTLSVTPNEGYTFINWTESGEVVSGLATYSFTVTGSRDLVANFEELGENVELLLYEPFEEYTVGDMIAAAGHDWWTTWSNAPGSGEDGVIADYGGTQCGHLTYGNDLVLLLGDEESGKYDLEFDILVPEGKNGYFNILHHFAGSNSTWAMQCYLHLTNNGTYSTSAPGHGTVHAGSNATADVPCVYNEWMHFRLNVDTDTDVARYYYTAPGQEEVLVCEWQWSLDSFGNSTVGRTLAAMDFFPSENSATSEYYLDNFSFKRIGGASASAFNITPNTVAEILGEDVVSSVNITLNNEGNSIGEWVGWVDFGQGGDGTQSAELAYHNGESGSNIGSSTEFTREMAIRLPITTYGVTATGMKITSVDYYINSSYKSADDHYTFRIYGQGVNNQPGVLLAEQTIVSSELDKWITATFDEAVYLTGQTIWVTVGLQQSADEYPMSMDGGDYDKESDGNWLKTNGGLFDHCYTPEGGISGAWMITVHCEGELVPAAWASINKSDGSLSGGQSDVITLTLNPTGLAHGTYNANLIINTNDENMSHVEIPVTLHYVSINTPTYVDLGLPSGTLWATCNLGANVPEEYGDYFAWGETQPKDYYDWSTYQYGDGSPFTKYTGSDGLYTLLPEDDAATANWGSDWRMPTKEEYEELYNNTTVTYTTQNGVNGRLFTASNGNTLFLPAAGGRLDGLFNDGSWGYYWSSTLYSDYPDNAWYFYIYSDGYDMNLDYRFHGFSVRPVRSSQNLSFNINATPNPAEGGVIEGTGSYEQGADCTLTATATEGYTFINWTENGEVVSTENPYTFTVTGDRELVANFSVSGGSEPNYVDLGLPSGTLWATFNVGANSPEEYGDYFAWGETQPKDDYSWDTYQYGDGSTFTKYTGSDGLTTLLPEDDAATANWGEDWRMPANEEFEELYNNTTCTWTTQNGVDGRLFTASNGNSLFLPAVGSFGFYWSSTLVAGISSNAWDFGFYSDYYGMDYNYRYNGFSVRPVRSGQNVSFNINATPNPAEGGEVSGGGAYESDADCTLTATANEGYLFMNWTENGEVVSTENPYTFTVTGDRELVANFMSVLASLSDDFNDGVIDSTLWTYRGPTVYEADGLMKIEQNSTDADVRLTTLPMSLSPLGQIVMKRSFMVHRNNNYFSGGFAINLNGVGDEQSNIRVAYWDESYAGKYGTYLDASIDGQITETYLCDAVFDTWLTETVIVDTESGTLYYYLNNELVATATVAGLSSKEVSYYTVKFWPYGWWTGHYQYMDYININSTLDEYYTVNATANPEEGGTVSDGGTIQFGQTYTLTATPNEGYAFMYWTENGQVVSNEAEYSFVVVADRELVANFSLPLNITAEASPVEYGTVSGVGEYDYGSECTLSAIPNENYSFMYWTEDGEQVSFDADYTFIVTSDRHLVANFCPMLNITASAIPEEGGTVTGAGEYDYGTECTLTATANEDYNFVNWTKDDNVVATSTSISFVVTEDGDYVAHFAPRAVGMVTAMYDPDPEDNQSPYVRVCWSRESSMREDFESGDFNMLAWETNSWVISENNPFEGNYCMSSANHGNNSSSYAQVTVSIPDDRQMSFYSRISSENGYDYGHFYIDGQEMGSWSGGGSWEQHIYDVTAGAHTFTWSYSKDYSVSNNDDCFYVDNINFVGSDRGDRAVNHYTVYRDTYPASGTPDVIANNVVDTCYVDTNWSPLSEGWYRYGIKAVYSESDTNSLYVSDVIWSNRILRAYPHTIIAIANPEEGGTITGAGDYILNTECTLTAAANEGYTFVNWTENGEVVSTEAEYSFSVTGDRDLVANFIRLLPSISDDFNDGVINEELWTAIGTHVLEEDGLLKLQQNVTDNYTALESKPLSIPEDNQIVINRLFLLHEQLHSSSWGDHYFYGNVNIKLNGSDDNYIGIQYLDDDYENRHGTYLHVALNGEHSETRICDASFDTWVKEQIVINLADESFSYYLSDTLVATLDMPGVSTHLTHYYTVRFKPDGWWTGHYHNMNYVNINDDTQFMATVNVSANPEAGGVVTGFGIYEEGQVCDLTATANEGYTFINWTKDGEEVSTEQTYSFTVTGGGNYVANFELYSYDITAMANPSVGGTVTGAGTYYHFETCTLTATASEGYTFLNWTKDGEVITDDPTYSFTVTEAGDYVANFELNSYDITVMANPNAGGTVTGAGTYYHFETCTLTATASEGYHFVNWTKDGEEVSTEQTYSFTVTGGGNYVANFELYSYDITAMANPSVGGTVTGAGTYHHFETCTLTATASEGYTFLNWTKDGEVITDDPTYSFTVTEAGDYVANFELNSYDITAMANPDAGGTVAGAGTYYHFETCTLTATASEGYTFLNWTKDGEVITDDPTYSFTVTEAGDYVANFELNSYVITATANPSVGGTVAGAGTYYHFETCTLTATASEGYTFLNWTKDGEVITDNPTYSFTVTGGGEYVANFELNSYTITAVANNNAGGTVTGAGTYNHFETCTLTATANEGYTFINWTENGEVVTVAPTYSFMVIGERNLVANFELNSYDITVAANLSEGGTVTGGGTYYHFETCTLTATVNEYYIFLNWTKDGEVVSTELTYSFTVTGGGDYVANFELYSYDITAAANPNEGGVITGAGTYYHFETCTLTATANEGYTFINWTKDGEEVTSNPSFSFTVTEAVDYVAHFERNSYIITATANPNEGGFITGTGAYYHFETCTLTATANEGFTFINWTENGTEVSTNAEYSFTVTDDREIVANFINIQSTALAEGWTWYSTCIELSDHDGLGMIEQGLGDNGILIKSHVDGFVTYDEGMWMGSLNAINNESMYLFNTSAPCVLNITGDFAVPSQHPITLYPGWNWIGYPSHSSTDINVAFSNLSPNENDLVKTQIGFATYDESMGWTGTFNTLEVGTGMMYYSSNSQTVSFVYNEGAKGGVLLENITADGNHYVPKVSAYPYNMNMIAVVELGDAEARSGEFELSAFAGDECRGSVRLLYVETLDRYIAFMTLNGNEAATLTMRLVDTETGVEYMSEQNFEFETNAIIGSLREPVVLRFNNAMTQCDSYLSRMELYPNPVEAGASFKLNTPDHLEGEVRVEVINALGAVLSTEKTNRFPASMNAPRVPGVYTVRVTMDNHGSYSCKLIVK